MNLIVTCWYNACSTSTVTLPDGIVWDDIESHYVKWNSFFYKVKGEEEWREVDLQDVSVENMDCKRPSGVDIEYADEDGFSTGESVLGGEAE